MPSPPPAPMFGPSPPLPLAGRDADRRVIVLGAAGAVLVCIAVGVVGPQLGEGPWQRVLATGALLVANLAAYAWSRRFSWFLHGVLVVAGVAPLWVALGWRDLPLAMSTLMWGALAPVAAALVASRATTIFWLAVLLLNHPAALLALANAEPRPSRPGWLDTMGLLANNLPLVLLLVFVIALLVRSRRDATRRLEQAHQRSEALLLNVLPASIAERLKGGALTIVDKFEEATILFADIVGFTELSARTAPERLIVLLNELFTQFDIIADRHGLEKIKTIGDAYMAAAGVPVPRADHARDAADAAIDMLAAVRAYRERSGSALDIRVGINSGPVVAGVIGSKKFSYDLWGDAVNTASRMESHGISGEIQITDSVRQRLGASYVVEERGEVGVKGKGAMRTWMLRGRAGGERVGSIHLSSERELPDALVAK